MVSHVRSYFDGDDRDHWLVVPTYYFLFGFEVTPGNIAHIAHIPVTIDLGRIRTGWRVFIREVHAVDRQARHVPGVDVATKVARLPAEGANTIVLIRSSNTARHRATGKTLRSGRSWGKRWRDRSAGRGRCIGRRDRRAGGRIGRRNRAASWGRCIRRCGRGTGRSWRVGRCDRRSAGLIAPSLRAADIAGDRGPIRVARGQGTGGVPPVVRSIERATPIP